MKELVALGKSGKLTYASGGNGSAPHLSGELLQMVAGIPLIHVPFKGSGPGVVALLGNQVSMMFVGPLSADPYVKAGRLRALAVADTKRSTVMPEVPTVAEAGFPGTEAGTWYGILAPAGTPDAVTSAVHDALLKALAEPEAAKRVKTQGAEIIGSGSREFGRVLRSEIAKWTRLVQQAGLTGQ
jgi:tripartite-type tricarboxylate transporter receptor subunit TctC